VIGVRLLLYVMWIVEGAFEGDTAASLVGLDLTILAVVDIPKSDD
jgi:hypothetical protein